MIRTSSNYACYKIGGLPFAPNSDRPAMLCPVAVVNGENFKVSSLKMCIRDRLNIVGTAITL